MTPSPKKHGPSGEAVWLPKGTKPLPDQAILHDILDYNPETGALTWKTRSAKYFTDEVQHKSWNTQYAGMPAFAQARASRLEGRLFGKKWFAHRIAWKHFYGADPAVIDHINGNCHDREAMRAAVLQRLVAGARRTFGKAGTRSQPPERWASTG